MPYRLIFRKQLVDFPAHINIFKYKRTMLLFGWQGSIESDLFSSCIFIMNTTFHF